MFEVGKKVIAIKDHPNGVFKKGDVFELLAIKKCQCRCNDLSLDIGFTTDEYPSTWCRFCKTSYEENGTWWFTEKRFAPYDDSLSSITVEELLEEVEGTAECYYEVQ